MIERLIEQCIIKTKKILEEGLSQRLFHFCPISSAYSIVKSNSFKLTSVENRPSDKELTSLPIDKEHRKQYNYYMCFSRTPSSLAGYVSMRRNKTGGINWKQTLVRIEVDGEKLSSNFKGMPVNYFNDKHLPKINHYKTNSVGDSNEKVTDKYGNTYYKSMTVNTLDNTGRINLTDMPRYVEHIPDKTDNRGRKREKIGIDYGVYDRNQMSEYEDRLFSNKEYISNLKEHKIIKRIDIFISKRILKQGTKSNSASDIFYMVDEIINEYGNLVHIYNNFSSFEGMNIINSISGYAFKKQYLEIQKNSYYDTHEKIEDPNNIKLIPSELKTIVRYATILGFYGYKGEWELTTKKNSEYILNSIGINIQDNQVQYSIADTISQIEKAGEKFFSYQSQFLKVEIEEIPPYKYKKYIVPLIRIQNAQEESYFRRTGTKITMLSIKINYCKNKPI